MTEPNPHGRFAFDLEVITTCDGKPDDFQDYTQFELLAIGVGYQPSPSAPIDATVLFRDGPSTDAELDLIEELCDWMDVRSGDTYYTFNGEEFDLPQLLGRAKECAKETGRMDALNRVDTLINDYTHDDLCPDAWNAFGDYTSLEETAEQVGCKPVETMWDDYNHGVSPRSWRTSDRGDPTVGGRDVPGFGEVYLSHYENGTTDSAAFRELKSLLYDYTVKDVQPLFRIADARPFVGEVSAQSSNSSANALTGTEEV